MNSLVSGLMFIFLLPAFALAQAITTEEMATPIVQGDPSVTSRTCERPSVFVYSMSTLKKFSYEPVQVAEGSLDFSPTIVGTVDMRIIGCTVVIFPPPTFHRWREIVVIDGNLLKVQQTIPLPLDTLRIVLLNERIGIASYVDTAQGRGVLFLQIDLVAGSTTSIPATDPRVLQSFNSPPSGSYVFCNSQQ